MTAHTQPFLPLDDDAAQQRAILRETRNDAARDASRKMTGKRAEVLKWISNMGAKGLTMGEMAAITGRSINQWTQPFTELRDWGVIRATNERRNKGTVHVIVRTITVKPDGSWE
jgi:predicted transcriptional regulator